MIFALIAKFLLNAPPAIQAAVLGLCTGLFATASTEANDRDPLLRTVVAEVVAIGLLAGVAFYLSLRADQRRRGRAEQSAVWVYGVYVVVWVGALTAAVAALFGAGGIKVAALAIVPLVLLAAPAFEAFKLLLHWSGAGQRRED
jgi:uncharacterized membrane protein